jgi:hypothetical protein
MITSIDQITPKVLKRAKQSVSYFAEKFLNYNFYIYQEGLANDPYPRKMGLFSRQLGKTDTIAVVATHQINMFPGSAVGIMGQDESGGMKPFKRIKLFQRFNPLLSSFLPHEHDLETRMELSLLGDNGRPSTVKYFPPGMEGKSIRGEVIDLLILDEADFIHPDVFPAALPTTSSTHGKILMTTTPSRKIGGPFYKRFQDAWDARMKFEGLRPLAPGEEPYKTPVGRKYGFVGYHYDYTWGLKVINPITKLPQINIYEVESARNSNYYEFEREYLARWSESSSTFFSSHTIFNSLVETGYRLSSNQRPYYIMGVDFGRLHDYTAIVVGEVNEVTDMVVIIHTFRIRRNDWQIIFEHVIDIINQFSVTYVIFDKKNVGDVLSVWLRNISRHISFNLRGESMDLVPKARMYNNAKMGMGLGRVLIQKNHEELIHELQNITEEESHISKIQKIHSPKGSFDDFADAFVLAISHIRFVGVETDRAAETVPHRPFFEVYEPNTIGTQYGDIYTSSDSLFTHDNYEFSVDTEFK